MSDLNENIAKILKKHHFAFFATMTAEKKPKPWVRYVFVNSDKDFNIWFATFKGSRKVNHIKQNPEVHLTMGTDSPKEMSDYLQIQGKAKLVTDKKTLKDLWKKEWGHYFKGAEDPNYAIITVTPYRIEHVNMTGTAQVWHANETKAPKAVKAKKTVKAAKAVKTAKSVKPTKPAKKTKK